jgi:hypothetical protein
MSEVRQLVEADGTLTLTDLMEVVSWWNSVVDAPYRDLLNAAIVGGEE